MTIDELLSLAALTANDEIPVWDAEAADEPTKKIKAQNLAASVKALAGLVGEAELTEQLADKADVIVDTASGAIASFPDGAAVAAKDITIGIEPVQAGSGDPSPENVRPISGWTGANVTRTGKNLFDKNSAIDGLWKSDGSFDPQPTGYLTVYCTVKPNTTYILSGNASWDSSRMCFFNSKNPTTFTRRQIDNPSPLVFTTDEDTVLVSFGPSEASYGEGSGIQLELGSTVTSYEPYTGTTYPISWQSEAGTVYGGTLDVTTGLLTVDRASYTLTESSSVISLVGRRFSIGKPSYFAAEAVQIANENKVISNQAKSLYSDRYGPYFSVTNTLIYINKLSEDDTIDSFKSRLTENNLVIVAMLAEPLVIQLDPVTVTTLLGQNNVWADTGDSTVTYRADTKLYIQKINAPTDDDMIADAQIASGRYFIVGGNLYRSTTTIPAGDAINPGSNCILTNLADALNALNT